ncbi:MAG: RNA polymerase sigma factor [Bryobacteraceae bacterium]|jgi:RNA polymerase sigma-70 factor (ECF subfamily)
MHSATDDDLMLEVRDGDVRKLGVLFERYQAPLFNYYLRMSGDRAASEDLVQEAFFRILRFRQTFQAGSSFATWMYRIARNLSIDQFRKSRREVGLEPDAELPADQPSAAESLEAKQEAALVRRALAKLPQEKRELLVLSRYHGLKYEQIAEMLGCQASAVKTRVFRALGELRQIYFGMRKEPL